MFKIGEFSKLTQVSIRMLRYYDEIDLLKPTEVDKYTGYRLYSVEQIQELQKIVLLRDMDFTTAEIIETVRNWSTPSLIQQLLLKQHEIHKNICTQKERLTKIKIAIQDLQKDKLSIHYNIIIKSIPSFYILSYRKKIPDYFCEGKLWEDFFHFINKHDIIMPHPAMTLTIFHEDAKQEDVVEEAVDIEVAMIINDIRKYNAGNLNELTLRILDAVDTMASIMVTGSYNNIGTAFHSFAMWLENHKQYQISGDVRQICHRGLHECNSPDEYLTEIQVPIKKLY